MSLRRKIILLFGLLAIVPLLVLAGFSYWHARIFLHDVVRDQLRQSAQAAAEDLDRATSEIDSRVETLAVLLSSESFSAGRTSPADVERTTDSLLADAVFVGVRGPSAPLQVLAGAVPTDEAVCISGESTRLLKFSREVPWEGRAATLLVGFWVADLVAREGWSQGRALTVVDLAGGMIVYADHCDGPRADDPAGQAPWIPAVVGSTEGSGVFGFRAEGEESAGAFMRVSADGLAVVATTSLAGITAPLSRLATAYWVFVLGLGMATSLAFAVLIGHFTRSLSELARAAEEIGLGELDPWLPLHTSGELGQLTAAFGDMLARIRQMMAQVDQSGRLAVVGQLSAYLAHEIRNPLSSIKLNLQRLRRWTRLGDLPEFCLEPLEISLREVDRLNASVTGVLQLSRAEGSPREVVSLHQLVEECADLLASKFRRQGVGLNLDLDAEVDHVLARVGQVKSAVLNLMVNALEAQPNGGRLEIRSRLSRAPEMGGPVVALHFADEGGGVPAEIRDRIFEPFFTTKAGGSGIGLAMASQSVKDTGGDLYLAPSFSVGRGAEFVVVFPLASLESSRRVPRPRGTALASAPNYHGESQIPAEELSPASVVEEATEAEAESSEASGVPTHLLTPEGLRAVLALSRPDSEEEIH